MKKFKHILSCLLLFAFALIFGAGLDVAQSLSESTAFTESDSYIKVQTIVGQNGAVLQGFYFTTNQQTLLEQGASTQTIQSFKNALLSQINHLRNLMIASFTNIYLQNPQTEFVIGEGGGLEVALVSDSNEDVLGFQLLFTSQEAWSFYHPQTDTELPSQQGKPEFIITHISQGQIIFAQTLSNLNITVGQYLKNIYLSAGQTVGLEVEEIYNPQFVYEYALSSSKVHSNADEVVLSSDGLYHHIWQMSEEELESDGEIKLYFYQANKEWWYLTIICVGIAIVLLGATISFILKKRKIKSKIA